MPPARVARSLTPHTSSTGLQLVISHLQVCQSERNVQTYDANQTDIIRSYRNTQHRKVGSQLLKKT